LYNRARMSRQDSARLDQAIVDPRIRLPQPLLQRNLRLPIQYLAQPGIITVSSPYTLGLRQIIPLVACLARYPRDHVDQLVYRDQPILSQIDGIVVIRLHEPINSFHAVINVAVGPSLVSIAPNLNNIFGLGEADLSANCRRRLFPAAVISPLRPENIMKPDNM